MDKKGLLKRYKRLCGHLICESLGYFTPVDAGVFLKCYKESKPFYCEWLLHIKKYSPGKGWGDIMKEVLSRAIKHRHGHKGFMNNYQLARALVNKSLAKGKDPILASWF